MHRYLITFLISLLLYFTTQAQIIWENTNGPNGGLIADIGINSKGWLYAGGWWGGAGLYRSMDKGVTWTKSNKGFDDFEIFTITVNSNDDIFIGNDRQGMLRSTDDGETWEVLNEYPLVECWAIAFDKTGNIYAGDGDWSGIVKSTDNGETWTDWINLQTISLADGPNGYLYAGTWRGVYRSTDEGVNWVKVSDGLPDLSISCIEFDSAGTIYIGTGTGHSKGNGIYYSDNNGDKWIHLALQDTVVQSLLILENKFIAGTLEHGVLISGDSGKSWIASNAGLSNNNVFRLRITPDDEIFTASDTWGGIHKSTDYGATWKLIGLPRAPVTSVSENNSNCLYAGAYNGIHKMDLASGEWTDLGLNDFVIISAAAKNDSLLFAGTDQNGLFRSSDYGVTWERTAFDSNLSVNDLILQQDGSLILASRDVYITDDNGSTFHNLTNGKYGSFFTAIEINNPGDMFIGNSTGLYKRSNGSTEFAKIFSGDISGIEVNDRDSIFISQPNGGIFRSGNHGASWQKVYQGDATTVFITKNQGLLASIFNEGLIHSSNDGVSWNNISSDLKGGQYVSAFAEDKNGIIYAGSYHGLFRTKVPITSIKGAIELPADFGLSQNFPNPFNPKTVIEYSLPEADLVSLKVYDLLGKEVVSLVDGEQPAGRYSVEFDAGELSTGIYIYQLRAGINIQSRKMILLK